MVRATKKRITTVIFIVVLGTGLLVSPVIDWSAAWFVEWLDARAHKAWESEFVAAQGAERSHDFRKAEEHLLASYKMAEERTVPPNSDSQASAYALGRFYRRRGDDKRAAQFFEIARGAARIVYGEHSDKSAKATRNLVEISNESGSHTDELRYARRELAIRDGPARVKPEQLIRSLRNLGRALRETGAFVEALAILERAEKLQQDIVSEARNGDDVRIDLALIQSACGVAAFHAGELDRARRWFERALPILESIDSADAETMIRQIETVYERLVAE